MALFTTHFKEYERMTNLPQSCSVHQCGNLPHSVCNHCDHHFCHGHSNEHENQCSETLSYLANTIDKLNGRILAVEPHCIKQLERWRKEAYQSIDHYCNMKHQDLIEKKQENLTEELDYLRHKLDGSFREEHSTHNQLNQINHDIQLIEVKLIELEHLRLKVRPLIIEENLVTSQELFPLPRAHATIHIKSGQENAIGTNERHLLVERDNQYLCLIDRNFAIIDETPFNHDGIHSICWSSTINRFIIITFTGIFTLDEKTMMHEKCFTPFNDNWWRGTCSDDILFLSSAEWGSSIHEFDLRSQFQFLKTWYTPITCGKDEVICDLKYNNGFLAVAIFNKHKEESRLELRSSATLDCIWSIHIHGRCRCCSINGDQWLVMDHDHYRFFHISADGRLLTTDRYEHHQRLEDVTTWNENNIVILTKKTINLHDIH